MDLESAAKLSDIRHQIKLLYFQSNLLECFVNDLLDSKMIEKGHFSQISQAFNPVRVLKLVMEIFKDQAAAQKTQLKLLLDGGDPAQTDDNEHQLLTTGRGTPSYR